MLPPKYVLEPDNSPEKFQLASNVAVMVAKTLMDEWMIGAKETNDSAFSMWQNLAEKLYLYDYLCFPRLNHFDYFPGWAPKRIAEDLHKMKNNIGIHGAYTDMDVMRITGGKVPYCWPNPVIESGKYIHLDEISLLAAST